MQKLFGSFRNFLSTGKLRDEQKKKPADKQVYTELKTKATELFAILTELSFYNELKF